MKCGFFWPHVKKLDSARLLTLCLFLSHRLDSRQRKKQHTERLEDEKKQYTAIVGDMEEEMNDLRSQVEMLMRDKQATYDYIESMNHEKEEMIRVHTIETGELRKKIGVLSEHVQRLETSPAAAAAAAAGVNMSAGQQAMYDDGLDGMMMMPGGWGGCGFLNEHLDPIEVDLDTEIKDDSQQQQQQQQQLIAKKSESDKPAAPGGLLFMLLLVGAFVLSNLSMPPVHRVSEDVRVASASLLESVFNDAGVGAVNNPNTIVAAAPMPSGTLAQTWHAMSSSSSSSSATHAASTHMSLGDLGDQLTQPTQQQTNEQIFSMTPGQYNGVTEQDFVARPNQPLRSTSQGRRNLADAVAAIRHGISGHSGVGEVYTKSLLWDQIPNQIVREFASMISESTDGHPVAAM